MDKKWTSPQFAAIQDEGGALLISAAAGSGKTAVLVERAVRLITKEENPVDADKLLIMTFTNAAARELRSRMATRLEEMLRSDPRNTFLRKQSLLLRRAFIGTIDAFCQQLVKEQFARLEIPPDVSVGDVALLNQLSNDALEETMNEMYENSDFVKFAALYGQARNDAPAAQAIIDLYEFTRTLPNPEKVVVQFANQYTSETPVEATPWGQELLGHVQQAAQAQQHLLDTAIEIVREDEALFNYLETLQADKENVEKLAVFAASGEWDKAKEWLDYTEFGKLKAIRNYEGDGKEIVKTLRDKTKKIREEIGKNALVCTQKEYREELKQAQPMVSALVQAVLLYSEKYMRKKLFEKAFDFSDFEHYALKLLQDENEERTEFSYQVSRRYEVIMVDEYQDTNDLQAKLYECLAKADGSNLFYVGDVKQSIYRFRKANPGLFLQKKDAWAPYGNSEYPAVITLGHNFRSGSGVIGGVNFLFRVLMSKELGEIEYNEQEELIQGSVGENPDGFELHLFEDPESVGEAEYVAKRIASMIAQKYPIIQGENARPCVYDDFCVLLRSRANMQKYVMAMEELGIPVVSDAGDDLLNAPEVLPILAVLRAINNPGDDVSLAASLLGPLFDFSLDELTELRVNTPKGTLWNALVESEEPSAEKILQEFAFYRAAAGGMSVSDLCEELIQRTGYLSAVSAMEGGVARRQNVLRFLAWAGEASSNGRGGLSGFIRLLESGKGPASSDQTGVQGHVKVMTIHKSKGLEYPICFLADTTHLFNASDLKNRVQFHAELGIGISLREGSTLFPTIPLLAIRCRAKRETWSEEMRVLYVALTRPKQKMIITACYKDVTSELQKTADVLAGGLPLPFMLSKGRSLADWVLPAALVHPDAKPLLALAERAFLPEMQAAGHMEMSVQQIEQANEPKEQIEFTLTAKPDEVLLGQVKKEFSQKVARKPLAKVPVKVSVSALTKGKMINLRKRPSFMFDNGLTGAEKGTVQHAFMQFANLQMAQKDFEVEKERLVVQGYLEKEMAEKIDAHGLQTFFSSDLWKRMESAKEVFKEIDFITAVPAKLVEENLPKPLATETVLVQGIADVVLLYDGYAEIIDYKTDSRKTAQQLVETYQKQLQMYQVALEKKLEIPVKHLTIWSFELGREISVPIVKINENIL